MSAKAKKLLKQAIKAYQEEDGATEKGSFRDALTDIIHLADKHFIKERRKNYDPADYFCNRRDWSVVSAFGVFEEEIEEKELKRIFSIPEEKLPLYIHKKWRTLGGQEAFLKRLRKE